jgi:hypothetical protein
MSASIAQQSAREWFLFTIGVKKGRDIIAWADRVIAAEDKPPSRLIELATTAPERTDVFVAELEGLREGCDIWQAVIDGLGVVHDHVVAHPEDAARLASALDSFASWHPAGMPAELSFICRFDDAFFLAKEGIYGGHQAVYADFVFHLRPYKEKSGPAIG